MNSNRADVGVVGLAVMGKNLALNLNDRGLAVALWNLEAGVAAALAEQHSGRALLPCDSLEALVACLERPRRVLLMIRAGDPVDQVLAKLVGLLEPGDVVLDGGNSHYQDTRRRSAELAERDIHFMGVGVSGGESGARHGPSLMVGGSQVGWGIAEPMLAAIAATSEAGRCVAHLGSDGAGHFVKMVHNGIEYGDMQLLAEAYDVLRRVAGLDASAAADVFERFQRGPLESFLTELTARVLRVVDPQTKRPLVELVLDRAGQKGTGRWTLREALELGVPVPTLSAAVDARGLSALKALRERVAGRVAGVVSPSRVAADECAARLEDALLLSRWLAYAQGFALIHAASQHYQWGIERAEVARIWTGGCILRARLLGPIREAFLGEARLEHLVLDAGLQESARRCQPGLRWVVTRATEAGIPVPALCASLAYLDSLRSAVLPQNLTQAQRDAFGSHGFERVDAPGIAQHDAWQPGARISHD